MNGDRLLDPAVLKKQRIPILSQDERWQAESACIMDEELRILVTRQTALIQEEKQAHYLLIQLKRKKKEILNQLLELSGDLQRQKPEAEVQADRLKALLEKVNEELDHHQFKTESCPWEIQKLNLELMEETVRAGYERIVEDRGSIGQLERRIRLLRAELTALTDEKFSLEEESDQLVQYLHSLLGMEESDRLDALFLHGQEPKEAER